MTIDPLSTLALEQLRSTARLHEPTHIRAALLLRVREGDRQEALHGANFVAINEGRSFLEVLAEQVALYETHYAEWAHQRMRQADYEIELEQQEAARPRFLSPSRHD